MMKYRNQSNDYCFGKNERCFISGVDAVAQAIKTRLNLLEGEWWEDTEEGLPLFSKILGQIGSDETKVSIDLIIQERILGTNGVVSISNFESTYQNRTYSMSCDVITEYGETTVEVTF